MQDEQVEEDGILLVKDQEEPLLNIEEEEEEEEEFISRRKKRVGRPPKEWSSILLPKEVTFTFGRNASQFGSKKKRKKFKTPNHDNMAIIPSLHKPSSLGNVSTPPTICSPTLGQLVHGVIDGSFDAGFLVSLKMGNSDVLYHGVIFEPGMSIPLSKDTDVANNVKWHRQRPRLDGTPSTIPSLTTGEYILTPHPHNSTMRSFMDDGLPPTLLNSLAHTQPLGVSMSREQSPHAPNVHRNSRIDGHLGVIHTTSPLPYNRPFNPQNVIRLHNTHGDLNVSPYVDVSNSVPHMNIHVSPTREYYDAQRYIGNQMGKTNCQFGCTPSQDALQSKTFNPSTYIEETRHLTM